MFNFSAIDCNAQRNIDKYLFHSESGEPSAGAEYELWERLQTIQPYNAR